MASSASLPEIEEAGEVVGYKILTSDDDLVNGDVVEFEYRVTTFLDVTTQDAANEALAGWVKKEHDSVILRKLTLLNINLTPIGPQDTPLSEGEIEQRRQQFGEFTWSRWVVTYKARVTDNPIQVVAVIAVLAVAVALFAASYTLQETRLLLFGGVDSDGNETGGVTNPWKGGAASGIGSLVMVGLVALAGFALFKSKVAS